MPAKLEKHFLNYLSIRANEHTSSIHFLNRQEHYRDYSYENLWKDIQKYASYLKQQAIQPGDVVSIILPTCEEFLAAFFALQALKAIPVASYPPTSLMDLSNWNKRTKQQLDQVNGKHIITDKRINRVISNSIIGKDTHVHLIEEINSLTDFSFEINLKNYGEEDACFLQFSSGSTGNPKAILIKQKNAILNAHLIREALPSANNEISVACWLPLYHDIGIRLGFCTSVHP